MEHFKETMFVILALAVATLTGCSADGDENPNFCSYPEDNVVRLTAGVSEAWTTDLQSRVAYTSDNITEFGISIQNPQDVRYCYGNTKVTKSGTAWTPAVQMLWQRAGQKVNIYAYAPYNSKFTGYIYKTTDYVGSISADQTADTDHSDFLAFKAIGFRLNKDLVNGCVPIVFKHMLSQLNVTLKFDTSFNEKALLSKNPVAEVTVGGTIPGYTFNFAKQTVTCSTGSAVTVKAAQTDFTAASSKTDNARTVYSCILVPQTVAAGKLAIEVALSVGGMTKYYSYTNDKEFTLESGKSYALQLTIE